MTLTNLYDAEQLSAAILREMVRYTKMQQKDSVDIYLNSISALIDANTDFARSTLKGNPEAFARIAGGIERLIGALVEEMGLTDPNAPLIVEHVFMREYVAHIERQINGPISV